ncbi:MAG: hypothetical protein IJT87_03940, partial [Ruminiclostridium sp.]|nr:hypothetical protein [Ruminiclostridium sp.]
MNNKKFQTVNYPVAAFGLFEAGAAAQMIWGWFGNAWGVSWLCTYIAVVLITQLGIYNGVVGKGYHPIRSLYGVLPTCGFAFFFCIGFMFGAWITGAIGLACVAAAIVIIIPI